MLFASSCISQLLHWNRMKNQHKSISLSLFGGLDVPSAVRIGFGCLIRSRRPRFIVYSQSPRQRGHRHDVLWSLWRPESSSCLRRAVRIGFGSTICVFCVLPSIPLSVKVCACCRLDSSGLIWIHLGSSGSSGLIWAHLGPSKLIWAHLGPLGSSGLSWAHLCSSGLLEARLGSPGLIHAHLGSYG